MAQVSLQSPTAAAMNQAQDSIGSDLYPSTSRKVAAPEPNPNFSFPMLPPDERSPTHEPSSAQKRGGRRGSRPQNISISPSVPFSFPPLPSPGKTPPSFVRQESSPTRSISSQPRSGGHRRGGSEFIGGDGSMVGPGLMSTSPTKGEGALPSPPTSGRRRGHAHRRSGAISNHDVSFMLKPTAGERKLARSGSAPNSPCDPDSRKHFLPPLEHSQSQPTLHRPLPDDFIPPVPKQASPATAQSRPRVGFSDTLEFIPRPLSTISSDTSSSFSTIRASHSLTGSMSSVISTGTSSPPSAKKNRSPSESLRERRMGDQRPKTADSLSNYSPSSHAARRQSPSRPSSAGAGKMLSKAASLPPSPQSLAATDKENIHPSNESDNDLSPTSSNQVFAGQPQREFPDLNTLHKAHPRVHSDRPRSSPEAKAGRSQKKVKSWAGSLLSRKTKPKAPEEVAEPSTPTVPLREFAPMEGFSLDDVNFDEDTTCVIRSPGFEAPSAAPPTFTSPSWSRSADQESEIPGTVLDLDASWNDSTEAQNPATGYASAKHRMHSSGSTGGFIGPGMHYHRRAESAPALTPPSTTTGLHRLGSNPQMADVFEEEEEEEEAGKEDASTTTEEEEEEESRPSQESQQGEESEMRGLGVQVVDLGREDEAMPVRRPSKSVAPRDMASDNEDDLQNVIVEEEDEHDQDPEARHNILDVPVEIVEAADEPRFSVITKSSDGSTITPTLSAARSNNNVSSAIPSALDFAQISPQPSGDFNLSSSSTSPDVSHIYFDGPRLNTAASSITDRSTWSSTKAQEVSMPSCSTEDVPSLTSSASTMISGHPPQLSPSLASRSSAERSYSFSSVPALATRRHSRPITPGKRSSLASLSRLVGGSYGGEKSKLSSVEAFAAAGHEDDVAAGGGDRPDRKKRNRISRLMRFWKSKENLGTV